MRTMSWGVRRLLVMGFLGSGLLQATPVLAQEGDLALGDHRWTFDPGLPSASTTDAYTEPAIGSDGTIYIGHNPSLTSPSGTFYAINPDGSLRWSKSLPFHGTWEQQTMGFRIPSIDPAGNIYISAGRILYSFRPDGTENWQRSFNTSNPWNYAPYIYPIAIAEDGRIYMPLDDQALHELDPADGSTLWSFDSAGEHTFSFTRPITLRLDGNLLLPFWSGEFYFVEKDGSAYSKLFSADDPSGDTCMSVSASGKIFATQGGLYRQQTLRVYDNIAARATDVSSLPGITVPPLIDHSGRLYCPDRHGNLYCLRAQGYLPAWTKNGYADQAPILAQDGTLFAVAAGAASPVIHALDPNGNLRYAIAGTIEDPGAADPIYRYDHSEAIPILRLALQRDGTLIAASNNGKIYAFHGESGLSKADWPKLYGGYENAGRLTHLAPEITLQPVGGTVISGGGNSLRIESIARPAATTQWYRNGSPVGTGGTLYLGGDEAGEYHAVVQNAIGSVQSETVTVVARHRLTAFAPTGCSVAFDPPGPVYDHGEVVTLTVTLDVGYSFDRWTDASGTVGEEESITITMDRNRAFSAWISDVQAPELQIDGDVPSIVSDQPRFTLSGSVSDNARVFRMTISVNGGPPGVIPIGEDGSFTVTPDLVLGENTITLAVLDSNDLRTEQEFTVEWRPSHLWSFDVPLAAREAEVFEADLVLTSPGDVAGANVKIAANPTSLHLLDFAPSSELNGMFRTQSVVNGVLSFTFASLGNTVRKGNRVIGTLRYRVRSLPGELTETIRLTEIDLAGADGTPIDGVRSIENSNVVLSPRAIVGDVNNNGRYDTGDAQRLQRLLGGLDEFRAWDGPLNDVNRSGALDIGDVIVVLRTAAGLAEQPGANRRRSNSPRVQAGFDLAAPTARVVLDRVTASAGETVTAQVWIEDVPAQFGGAFYVLDYPIEALRLEDSNAFKSSPLLPPSTLQLWNLAPSQNDFANQTGSISFAAGSAESWPGSGAGGLIAEFTFTVQAGAMLPRAWPITLREMEIATDEGLTIVRTNPLSADFLGSTLTAAEWQSLHFEAEELEDPEISGWEADPDADGRRNLAEYFGGSDPKNPFGQPIACPVMVETPDGRTFAGLQVDYDPRAVSVDAVLQLSGNLLSWQEGEALTRQIEVDEQSEGGLRRKILIDAAPMGAGGPERFLRLKLSL